MHALRTRRLMLVGLAIAGLFAVGASAGQAGDPFIAGGRSTRVMPAGAVDVARAKAHAQALSTALGLPGKADRVERLDDRFDHRTYDEVTNRDAAGREVAITRFDLDGTIAMAVSLGWQPTTGAKVDGPAATKRAAALARAAGVALAGSPAARRSAGAGGWSIAWPRVVDGVPVRGDGVRVALWPDGSFHGLTKSERPLAARPATVIRADEARAAAEQFAAGTLDPAGELRLAHIEAAWVAPNDAFAPARADAPAATLRLAWIVTFEASGALSDRVTAVAVFVDAGDQTIIGGDVAE